MTTTTIDIQTVAVHDLDDEQRGLILYLAADIAEEESAPAYVCDQLTELGVLLTARSEDASA